MEHGGGDYYRSGAVLSLVAALALGAASSAQHAGDTDVVVMDGDVSEWAPGVHGMADGQFLYLRLTPDRVTTLQASMSTTLLALDVDADAETGLGLDQVASGLEDGGGLGVDLLVELSPGSGDGGPLESGSRVFGVTEAGRRVQLSHSDTGFLFLPTYAAEEYEIRLSRFPSSPESHDAAMSEAGMVRGRFLRISVNGDVEWASDEFSFEKPAADEERALHDAALPAKPAESVRVMTYNVLWGEPQENPGPLSRLVRAVDADVLLFQEWDLRDRSAERMSGAEIVSWFNEHAALESGEWSAVRSAATGVVIVTRGAVVSKGPNALMHLVAADGDLQMQRATRFVSARIETPLGEMIAASVHLKCCGSAGSWEDMARVSEAVAVNTSVLVDHETQPAEMIVVAGDFNLVGSRLPLDVMRQGMGRGLLPGSVVEALLLGEASAHTWRGLGDARFNPGRLDYAVVGGRRGRVAQSFLLDTSVLTDASLERMGLERGDTGFSDHLPIIFDISLTN